MTSLDLRPGKLSIVAYPGNEHTLTLTWPASELDGTTWTATLGGDAVDSITVDGDDLVIVFTTPTGDGVYDLVVTDTSVDPDAVMVVGKVRSTATAGAAATSSSVTVTRATATSAVTVVAAGPTGPTGATGPTGPTGPAGSDATVTTGAVDAAGAVMNTDTSTAAMSFVVDEDAMTSNSATKVPTQQSVKAYVDALSGTYVSAVVPTGLVGDGVTDDSAAIQAAIDAVEAAGGGTVFIPRGTYLIGTTLLVEGAAIDSNFDWALGGVAIVGEGMRGTILLGTSGDTLLQYGDAVNKQNLKLAELSLIGPGKADAGSIGLDSRTTGGGYVFDNVLVQDFAIGIRYYDNTLVDARHLNVRHCGIGLALGYYSDAQIYAACRFDSCDVGVHIGYWDTARSQSSPTESHVVTFATCMSNGCGVSYYVEGSSTECITWEGGYAESYTDTCIRLADPSFARALSATVRINNHYFNGSDAVNHAIEVNRAVRSVEINGGGFRNHVISPVHVRRTDAKVLITPGNYDSTSGELGNVKLPDATFQNVVDGRGVRVGQFPEPVTFAATLPTAGANWLGSRVLVSGVEYLCGLDSAATYRWFPVSGFIAANKPVAFNVPVTGTLTWSMANEARSTLITLPVGARITGARVRVNVSSGNISVGIFSADGGTRHATTGTIACPGTGNQAVTFTSAVALPPGIYVAALSCDNTTAQFFGTTIGQPYGASSHAASHPLPTTLSSVDAGGVGGVPVVGIIAG